MWCCAWHEVNTKSCIVMEEAANRWHSRGNMYIFLNRHRRDKVTHVCMSPCLFFVHFSRATYTDSNSKMLISVSVQCNDLYSYAKWLWHSTWNVLLEIKWCLVQRQVYLLRYYSHNTVIPETKWHKKSKLYHLNSKPKTAVHSKKLWHNSWTWKVESTANGSLATNKITKLFPKQ